MRQKALYIWIAMFMASMGFLGAQYMADSVGHTITNFDGVPIESNILDIIDIGEINIRTLNIIEANFTENTTAYNRVENPAVSGAYVAWEVIQLITGTYIFNLLVLIGMPTIFVVMFAIPYTILLAWFIWTAIRGI